MRTQREVEGPNADEIVDALVGAFVPLIAGERELVIGAYRLLAQAEPVDLHALAREVGWAPADVQERLGSWPGVFLDGEGRLVGLFGMAVEAVSAHQLRLAGHEPVWMWCAFDPLFIVPALGERADVVSTCPVTGESVYVRLEPGGGATVEPASTVVSLLLPNGPFDAEVRTSFCHFVHFFASPDAADVWIADHPGTFSVPFRDAAAIGRRLAAATLR
ncbi:MAG: organomercurial lyase [Acidimicrobiales bacterium]